jgi:predicted alpha/beta hydrolase family esterase
MGTKVITITIFVTKKSIANQINVRKHWISHWKENENIRGLVKYPNYHISDITKVVNMLMKYYCVLEWNILDDVVAHNLHAFKLLNMWVDQKTDPLRESITLKDTIVTMKYWIEL